jgi:hypothetical protein
MHAAEDGKYNVPCTYIINVLIVRACCYECNVIFVIYFANQLNVKIREIFLQIKHRSL